MGDSLLKKALCPPKNPDHEWDNEDFLDLVYWSHNILSIIFGLVWGLLKITGGFGIVSYLALSTVTGR